MYWKQCLFSPVLFNQSVVKKFFKVIIIIIIIIIILIPLESTFCKI